MALRWRVTAVRRDQAYPDHRTGNHRGATSVYRPVASALHRPETRPATENIAGQT